MNFFELDGETLDQKELYKADSSYQPLKRKSTPKEESKAVWHKHYRSPFRNRNPDRRTDLQKWKDYRTGLGVAQLASDFPAEVPALRQRMLEMLKETPLNWDERILNTVYLGYGGSPRLENGEKILQTVPRIIFFKPEPYQADVITPYAPNTFDSGVHSELLNFAPKVTGPITNEMAVDYFLERTIGKERIGLKGDSDAGEIGYSNMIWWNMTPFIKKQALKAEPSKSLVSAIEQEFRSVLKANASPEGRKELADFLKAETDRMSINVIAENGMGRTQAPALLNLREKDYHKMGERCYQQAGSIKAGTQCLNTIREKLLAQRQKDLDAKQAILDTLEGSQRWPQ